MSKKRTGSSIDDFLKDEGIFEEAQAQAITEIENWQRAEVLKKRKIALETCEVHDGMKAKVRGA